LPKTFVKLPSSPWLTHVKAKQGARVRLFCFPYAGSAAHIFRSWSSNLPETVDVLPVQLPGRGNRLSHPLFHRLPLLVRAAAEAFLPHLDLPFAFFGHSMGALIAFEVSRHLQHVYNLEPVHLFVSGHQAPQSIVNASPSYNLPRDEFLKHLARLRGTPTEVLEQPELLELVLPILRADFEVSETYNYEPSLPLNCPITALGGTEDTNVETKALQAWSEQTRAHFSVHIFPGDHFFIHSSQTLLLRFLSSKLEDETKKIR
jgi:medium-chain acyl-[acyl-carrier-protein] hydrolase